MHASNLPLALCLAFVACALTTLPSAGANAADAEQGGDCATESLVTVATEDWTAIAPYCTGLFLCEHPPPGKRCLFDLRVEARGDGVVGVTMRPQFIIREVKCFGIGSCVGLGSETTDRIFNGFECSGWGVAAFVHISCAARFHSYF